jgi:hypothetical protein
MTIERLMNCVCGHPERSHVPGGPCRVPDCPCDHFKPGDTLCSTQKGTPWASR